ncbi:histidine phosphatase family protein [Verrucomicrobiaceae bacterium N1E253]|uniref:Histidine phosphatase family protein n=1 Tax=Oceaniferula marina TaxID=2748318 RepID=A0A851GPZ2_9BACT|nr:histidine phosphatase family protein [Oceaniferula marina]NWK57185.1 histidine phosphatase family protein [Oceaniferula marina]
MELLLIRHAQAESHRFDDAARVLTEKGELQARSVGEFLKKNKLLPEVTLASPLIRAKQTAEIFCDVCGLDAPVIEPWLACGMRPNRAAAELKAYAEFERVAIVGHEPDFSYLAEWLLGCEAGGIHVRKASVIQISDVRPPSQGGYLQMLVPAKVHRAVSE